MRETRPQPTNYDLRLKTGGLFQPQSLVRSIAAEVIKKADKKHPADSVLRHELMRQRRVPPELKTAVSKAVFSYYRWFGWLDPLQSLPSRITKAVELQEFFSDQPAKFSESELLDKTIPKWAGELVDVSPEWVRSLQAEPKLWLRAQQGQGNTLAKKLDDSRPLHLPDAVLYEGEKDLFHTAEFHAGEFELQDINSQAVSLICDPKPNQTWWDACAGEGGKTLHLSALMENKGLIWASDRAEWRLKHLKRRAARARVFNYRAAVWNGGPKLPTKTKFDGVLVDAPCSGIGTWQRNPHARWTTTPEDVQELAEVQSQLLSNVTAAVKPGGKLVYAVCTLSRAETIEVVAAFAKRFPDFQPLPFINPFRLKEFPKSQLWLWPQDTGGSGMFIATWRRA